MDAKRLYANYRAEISEIISQIVDLKAAAIPLISLDLATQVIPQMMIDVGTIIGLSGSQKKQLILDALDLAVTEVFRELNEKTDLKNQSWDETLRDVIKKALPKLIDLLIKVENDKIVFNKKSVGCFGCC